MANTDIWANARALIGAEGDSDYDTINAFLEDNLATGTDIDLDTTAWSGYFAAATIASAGYAVPYGYSTSANWSAYGQPATEPAVGEIMILPPDSGGYSHIGIILDLTSDGRPVCIIGDQSDSVVYVPCELAGAVYRIPVSPSNSDLTQALAAGLSPAAAVSPSLGSSSGGAAAQIAQQLLASLMGGGQQKRQGSQIGNKDTPEKNKAREQSGPMPCGMQHEDVTGKQGKYSASKTFSPVSRLPSHEPFMGHATAQTQSNMTADGGGSGGSGGGGGGGGTTGRGNAADAVGVDGTPLANPGSFTNNTFSSKNDFSINAPVAVQRFMKDLKLTYSQAVGLVANLSYESAGLVAGKQEGAPVSGKGGLGWAQWTGSRRTEFINFVKSQGGSIYDPEMNYRMVVHDFTGKYKGALAALRAAGSAQEAVLAVERKYEIAGVPAIGGRAAYISKIDKAYRGAVASGGTPNPTGPTGPTAPANSQAAADKANKDAQKAASAQQIADKSKQSFADALQNSQGTSGGQGKTIKAAETLSKTNYDPKTSSSSPDAGTDQSKAVGGTPQGGSSSDGSGSGGSGSGSGDSGGGSDAGGSGGGGKLPVNDAPLPVPRDPSVDDSAKPITVPGGGGSATEKKIDFVDPSTVLGK